MNLHKAISTALSTLILHPEGHCTSIVILPVFYPRLRYTLTLIFRNQYYLHRATHSLCVGTERMVTEMSKQLATEKDRVAAQPSQVESPVHCTGPFCPPHPLGSLSLGRERREGRRVLLFPSRGQSLVTHDRPGPAGATRNPLPPSLPAAQTVCLTST